MADDKKRTSLPSYIAIRNKFDVDSIVAFFKVNKNELTPHADRWIQFCILKGDLFVYYRDEMSKAFYNYKAIRY